VEFTEKPPLEDGDTRLTALGVDQDLVLHGSDLDGRDFLGAAGLDGSSGGREPPPPGRIILLKSRKQWRFLIF
jgi:hypothetical protein